MRPLRSAITRAWPGVLGCGAGACLLLLACILPAADLGIAPPIQRLALQPQDAVEATWTISAPAGTAVTAIMADCACLRVLTPVPTRIGPDGRLDIRIRATGMRPGVEDILVATSAGILRAQVQIVGPGAGRGLDQLRNALADAAAQRYGVLAVVHDLRGQVRHCGCSAGALGGAGRLARLPGLAAELQPGLAVAWVLSGDGDGKRQGLGAMLADRGWTIGDPRVRVSAEPLPLLQAPGVVAVIPTVDVAAEHRRLLRPVLADGMAVELLLVDDAGIIRERRTMPVDDSLPDDPGVAERFRDTLTSTLRAEATPSQDCAGCHASAFAAWQRSRHARALDSLPAADRTDTCIGCHTTPLAAGVLAPAVSCQSCHGGGAAHIAAAGRVRTTGTVDCRSCHDARHHPAFNRETAWPLIGHGREAAP